LRTHESLEELLDATEGEHYQFKEWKTKDDLKEAAKICCALANCGGGKFVMGITDKRPRVVVGTLAFSQPERTRAVLMEKLRVRVDFYIISHENGRVLVFDVASRPLGLPIQVDGIAWWYNGDSHVAMPEDVRHRIYAESGHDFSADVCPGATIDDLSVEAIEMYRNTWISNRNNSNIASLTVEQLLRDSGAITDGGVTYAALILFGKRGRLTKYIPSAEVAFEYRSSEAAGPAQQRVDFKEGFFNYFDKICELVNLRNDEQHYQKGFQVLPVYTFNEKVVRESLLNAVSHRCYQQGGMILVRQYSRRIVIESPGGFPRGITVDNILNRQSARNTLIANIFHLCGLVERSGQGMNLMYELAVMEAKPLPDFTGSDEYYIMLTLNGQVYDPLMLALVKKTDEDVLKAMTTEDYTLLSIFFHRKKYAEYHKSAFTHLADLGLVEFTRRGVRLHNNGTILLFDKNDVHIVDDFMHSESRLVKVDDVDDVEVDETGGDYGTNGVNGGKSGGINIRENGVKYGVKYGVNGGVNGVNNIIVLNILQKEPTISLSDLSKESNIPRRTLDRVISYLKENNQIKRIGSSRAGYWEIIE
jgi:ATP-dependent DNA helicase RecG